MEVLNKHQLQRKLRRLAIQIWEHHHGDDSIILAGINNNGYRFAERLQEELSNLCPIKILLTRITLDPADPLSVPIKIEMKSKIIDKSNLIIVDDVANTGRTLFYAFKALIDVLPNQIEIAVLVDRKHKLFPVKVNYVGISLATTLKNDIHVDLKKDNVHLN